MITDHYRFLILDALNDLNKDILLENITIYYHEYDDKRGYTGCHKIVNCILFLDDIEFIDAGLIIKGKANYIREHDKALLSLDNTVTLLYDGHILSTMYIYNQLYYSLIG